MFEYVKYTLLFVIFVLLSCAATSSKEQKTLKKNSVTMRQLTAEEKRVIIDKGTEAPYSGQYVDNKEAGVYKCKQCGEPLYLSQDKFDSGCGWPSFDQEIKGAVREVPDADGLRTEIVCAKCGGHLGHVFKGEKFTPKDTRHCVNSISMDFESAEASPAVDTAIFAGGCFWGVEHLMQQQKGVKSVESGYIGGTVANPTYEQVCTKKTGHAEAVRIVFDPKLVSFEQLAKLFFEIHDPEQSNGQGPDLGPQYRSEIFYLSEDQKATASNLIELLRQKGYHPSTKLTPATVFYPAEDYHQDYYKNKGTEPYCHVYTKRF